MTPYPLITIVGGSGFLGRHLIRHLTREGYRIRVLVRDTVAAEYLRPAGGVGQIALQYADITKPETLAGKFTGSWAVINLVGILYESGKQNFQSVQVEGARRVAELAHEAGAERFIQVSALGAERALGSAYARSKKSGEDAVRAAFPAATILRPGLLIGPEDQFFQRFARMGLLLPALPLIGGGKTRFQPTLVTDAAAAIVAALNDAESAGKTYELGGPEVKTFREWLEKLRTVTHRKFALLAVPSGVARFIGRVISILPFPPLLTADQVRLLGYDNTVNPGAKSYRDLGIAPASVAAAMPSLLARFVKA